MKANGRHSWRGRTSLSSVDSRFGTRPEERSAAPTDVATDSAVAERDRLSVRAENVLKELAVELTGDRPPKGRWIPTDNLLRKLRFEHLFTARNCGPQTIDEIVRWAETRGVMIQRPLHAGKSLAAMWHDVIGKFPSGEFTQAEIAEALERSMRRRNTKIPVAVQAILLQLLTSGN